MSHHISENNLIAMGVTRKQSIYQKALKKILWIATLGFTQILDFLYPPKCPICNDPTIDQVGFCGSCWVELHFVTKPYCNICSKSLPNSYDTENLICGKCIKQKPSYDYARSILYFDEYSKKIIHALKYHDKTLIAKIMAKIMANKYPQEIASADIIIPVPMNKIKRLFRLYNHAQILAYELASLVEKKIIYDILIKSRNTKSQTSLSEKDRRKNLFGSITVQNKEKIKGKKILLIDDVITTGSTVDLCAKQLKKSGAKEVIILSIARTSK